MTIVLTLPALLYAGISDWKRRIIPNEAVLLLIMTGGLELIFSEYFSISVSERTLGMLIPGAVLFFIYIINPRVSGGGDLKLLAALGFCIGKALFWVMIVACIGGLFHCFIFRDKAAPLGSYLLLGAVVISILSL